MGVKVDGSATALVLCAGLALSQGALAQSPAKVTKADYDRAASMLSQTVNPLVDHAVQAVQWLDDTTFVYVDNDVNGTRLMRMDAVTGKAVVAFDHARMAKALGTAIGKPVDAKRLDKTISNVGLEADGRYDFTVKGTHYLCDVAKPRRIAKPVHPAKPGDGPAIPRPTASAKPSSATGTCGCARRPPARKRSSPPMA